MDTLYEDQYTFSFISRSFLLRMRTAGDKFVEQIYIQILCSDFFFPENPASCEIMCKNTVVPGRPQLIIWFMCISGWVPKATNTQSEYATLIAFVLQQWLHEHASLLRYTYFACRL
jgi:hypothetical protein